MSIAVFYHSNPTESSFLSEEESFHGAKVLRLKSDQEIHILDGKGKKYQARLENVDAKKCTFSNLKIIEQLENSPYKIHLFIAPTKQMERMEWMVEKCTEFGIHSIHFFTSRYSERKEIKLNRLEKIAIAALKQSKNLFLTEIHPIQPLKNLMSLKTDPNKNQKLFAYITTEPIQSLINSIESNKEYFLMIGPEGDFSKEESQELLTNNWRGFHLGKAILRTETAGIASTLAIHLFHEKIS
jgi:16S rRNA (uracil1498-N3)-methyltransferase